MFRISSPLCVGCVFTAKNLILAGPKAVTLFDPEPCEMRDLGSNFCLTEEHVKQRLPRAAASQRYLADLNQYVSVDVLPEPSLTEVRIRRHQGGVEEEEQPLLLKCPANFSVYVRRRVTTPSPHIKPPRLSLSRWNLRVVGSCMHIYPTDVAHQLSHQRKRLSM